MVRLNSGIFRIFPQKWQLRLKNENFEISRNSAYPWVIWAFFDYFADFYNLWTKHDLVGPNINRNVVTEVFRTYQLSRLIPSRYLRLSGMVHVHLECTVLWACKSTCHVITRRPVTWLIIISKKLYHWSIRRVLKGAHIDQEILWIKPTKYQQKLRYFLNLNQRY